MPHKKRFYHPPGKRSIYPKNLNVDSPPLTPHHVSTQHHRSEIVWETDPRAAAELYYEYLLAEGWEVDLGGSLEHEGNFDVYCRDGLDVYVREMKGV